MAAAGLGRFAAGNLSAEDGAGTVEPMFVSRGGAFQTFIFGILSPVVILFTVVNNSFVCAVLLKPSMRTATNSVLVALAVADTMTGVLPLPYFIYFFTLGNWKDWVPYDWCYAYKITYELLPTVFHTASIWLTTALAVQRYMCVCQPKYSRLLCSQRATAVAIAAIYVASVLAHASRFFDYRYDAVLVSTAVEDRGIGSGLGCVERFSPWADSLQHAYFPAYVWFRVLCIHVIPCALLLVINAVLICVIRKASDKRRSLLIQNREREWRSVRESSYTTLMLVVVVGVFLLVELPLGVALVLVIAQNSLDAVAIDEEMQQTIYVAINFAILLSYPLNFFIYARMSKSFRDSVVASLRGCRGRFLASVRRYKAWAAEPRADVTLPQLAPALKAKGSHGKTTTSASSSCATELTALG